MLLGRARSQLTSVAGILISTIALAEVGRIDQVANDGCR